MLKKRKFDQLIQLLLLTAILILSPVLPVSAQTASTQPDLAVITPENIRDLQLLTSIGQGRLTGEFALQSNGSLIAAAVTSGVALFDQANGKQAGFIDIGFTPTALAVSPDGLTLAVVYNVPTGKIITAKDKLYTGPEYQQQIGFYSLPGGRQAFPTVTDLKECGQSNIWQIAFTPDGKGLVFEKIYGDKTAGKRFCALSFQERKVTRTLDIPASATSALSPNGQYVAVLPLNANHQANKAIVYETQGFKSIAELTFPLTQWPEIQFARSGSHLALLYFTGQTDKTPHAAQFWSLPDGKPDFILQSDEMISYDVFGGKPEQQTDRILSLDVSPDRAWAVTGMQNGKIILWNMKTGKKEKELGILSWTSTQPTGNKGGALTEIKRSYVEPVEFSADGKTLVAAENFTTLGQGGQIHVYRVEDGKEIAAFFGMIASSGDIQMGFSPDSRKICYGGSRDGSVKVYNTADGSLAFDLKGHSDTVNRAEFSPDGSLIATASDDKTIRLWNAKTGQGAGILSGHTARVNQLAFSFDGNWLVSGADDGTLRRWKTGDGSLLETHYLGNESWRVEFLSVLPDGRSVAYYITKYPSPLTGFISKQILWNVETGAEIRIGNGKVFITNMANGQKTFAGYSNTGGKVVGALALDGTITLLASGIRSPYGNGNLAGMALSPDNRLLVSGNGYGLHTWKINGSSASFTGLAATAEPVPMYGASYLFSPNGKILAFTDGGVVYLMGVPVQ